MWDTAQTASGSRLTIEYRLDGRPVTLVATSLQPGGKWFAPPVCRVREPNMEHRRINVRWSGEIDPGIRVRVEEALDHAFRADDSVQSAEVELECLPFSAGRNPACRILEARIVTAPGDQVSRSVAVARVTGALHRGGMIATGLPALDES